MKTTNYFDTFIRVADDCPAEKGEIPPLRGSSKTIARMQYEMISENSYRYTSDDVIFMVHAERKKIPQSKNEREKFFSKGRACLRSSPLCKRYGWGVHSNSEGYIAVYPIESNKYHELSKDDELKQVKAMRSKSA